MEHDDDELLEELSKLVRGDCGDLAKVRDSSILEVQHMGTNRVATDEELDEHALLEELSNLS
jgi:hypothetical protein